MIPPPTYDPTVTAGRAAADDPLSPPFAPWRFMLAVDEVNYDLDELVQFGHQHHGTTVLNLASGVNFGPPPARMASFILRCATDPLFWHDYDGPQGHVVGRAAIAACESVRSGGRVRLGVDNVVVTAGASAALTLAARALVGAPGPGAAGPAQALLPVPTFPLVGAALAAAGFEIVEVASNQRTPGLPTVDELIDRATPRTRLVYVNTFNNPTGEHYDEAALRRLLRWARERHVIVLHDTVSSDVSAGSRLPHLLSLAADEGHLDGVVTVGSLSKTRALPGFRVGWLIAEATLVERIARANELNAPSSPSIAAPALLLDRMASAVADGPDDSVHLDVRLAHAWRTFLALVEPYAAVIGGLSRLLTAVHDELVHAGVVRELRHWRTAMGRTLATNAELLTSQYADLVAEVPPWRGDFNTFVRIPGLDGCDYLGTTHRLFREYGLQILPAPAFGFDEPWWRRRGYFTRLSFALPAESWTEGLSRLRLAVRQIGRS